MSKTNLDTAIKKAVKEEGLARPSLNFSANVMQAIEVTNVTPAYKPLISKRVWFVAATVLIALVGYAFISGNITTGNSLLGDTELAEKVSVFFESLQFDGVNFDGFAISKTLSYTLIASLLMILVQIPIIKRLFDRQWSV